MVSQTKGENDFPHTAVLASGVIDHWKKKDGIYQIWLIGVYLTGKVDGDKKVKTKKKSVLAVLKDWEPTFYVRWERMEALENFKRWSKDEDHLKIAEDVLQR